MTNQDEWFYREPSDSQGPGTAWSRGSNAWGNQEPNGLRPHQSLAGTQYRGNQAPADWGRENSGTGQSVGDPWAEPGSGRPPPDAYRGYGPAPRAGQTQWDLPATRDYRPTPTGNHPLGPENRPRTREQYAPSRGRQEPPPPAKLWGLVSLAAALGLLLDSFAVAKAPTNYSFAGLLFWPAAVLPNVVFAAVLLSRRLSRPLRHFTIALVGIYSAAVYRMSSPFVPGGFDEHLHERTLSDLLHGSGLFAPNPLLNVSPNYPGMELFTGIVTRLGAVPQMVAVTLVVLLCRYLLVLAIYEGARTINPSPRFASLVVLLYATSPQFFFFNSQFAYQTMAVPLGLGGLLLVRRAQLSRGPAASRLVGAGIIVLAATVVTHHITSWFVFVFLIGWAVLTPRERRRQLAIASVGMGLALGIWTAAIFGKMWGYFVPVLEQSIQQAAGILGGSNNGRSPLGGSTAGYVTPEWQKMILIIYALVYSCGALVFGFILLKRAFSGRGRVLGLVGFSALFYPVSLAAHFVPSAASIGDRASTFLFLPLSLAASLVFVQDHRVISPQRARRRTPGSRVRPRTYSIFACLIGLAYMGGILVGSGPGWALLPGTFMVVADSRSQDSHTLAAVKWAAAHLPPGSRITADRVPADLLSGEARLWPIFGPQNGIDWASIYFAPQWSSYQTNVLREVGISYIYVDQRLEDSLPNEGYYIYQGETQTPARLTKQDLSKFAHIPGLKAVYRRGSIAIYSTSGLGVPTELTGYSGNRQTGFGIPGDAILGITAVLAAYGLRRRLQWVVDVLRDARLVGGIAVVMSAVIFIGFILFGLRITPGAGFSIGALMTGFVLLAISRHRHGRRIFPLGGRHVRVDPLIAIALVICVLAVVISLRAAWVLDVADVNNILQVSVR
jgi:hypothetical protein